MHANTLEKWKPQEGYTPNERDMQGPEVWLTSDENVDHPNELNDSFWTRLF